MGFRPPRKIYNLDFTGTEFEGLQVKMRGMTVGEELELDDLRGKEGGGRRVFELMTGLLVEWNVDDEQGQPVPATFEGVCTQDSTFIMTILDALQTANSGVPDPLPQSSPSGEPSPAASIPMAPLSPSPENSAVPA
ncbi:hypothetical protein K4749_01385 [Streptomyces sp. TRM72054]|uniref:hypothetical protein n=1 Tax=Streptomyces sp. TRM72054 TaxID=2870562 RepID=UPI001C8C8FB1|nr:hypothetical protein [Streptomyces sp. TRM72054]MBX9392284.1 hypothetical protein [Streptomyces sp. TRM72054]